MQNSPRLCIWLTTLVNSEYEYTRSRSQNPMLIQMTMLCGLFRHLYYTEIYNTCHINIQLSNISPMETVNIKIENNHNQYFPDFSLYCRYGSLNQFNQYNDILLQLILFFHTVNRQVI